MGLLGSFLAIKRESYLRVSENDVGSSEAVRLTSESFVDITHWEIESSLNRLKLTETQNLQSFASSKSLHILFDTSSDFGDFMSQIKALCLIRCDYFDGLTFVKCLGQGAQAQVALYLSEVVKPDDDMLNK